MGTQVIPFLAVTAVVMLVPGPSVLYAVSQRLERGPRAGLFAVLGLESGLCLHVVAACLGLSAVLAASEGLLRALQLGGAAYLAWLGLAMLRRRRPAPTPTGATHAAPAGLVRVFTSGVLIDVLNPKTVLFFVAVLPQFVGGGPVAPQLAVLGACVVAMALVVDGGYALLAGRLQRRHSSARARRVVELASGSAFLGLAWWAALG